MGKKSAKKNVPAKKKLLQAPSSDSDSSDDIPLAQATKSYKRNIKDDQGKRFDFLLKQTEIFSHFITGGKTAEQNEEKRGRKKKNAAPASTSKKDEDTEEGGRRRRKAKRAEDDEILKGTVAQRSNDVFFDTTPHYIKNGEMRDYQLRGLNWMISLMDNGINGILADEMGLGKTLQTVSLIGYLKHFRQNNGPHIVIVPKSTLQNWLNEFKRWCPTLTVICLIGEKNARAEFISDVMKGTEWDVCVTSFDMCLRETATLKRFNWQYLVIDEAHRIKNENSLLSEIVRRFRTTYRLLLTGTPLQNNLHELWSLLNFLLPDVFNNSEDFDTWFASSNLDDQALVQRLHAILKPFLLRRLKSEVETSLLPKKEIKVYVGMSKMQRDWYSKVLLKDIDVVTGSGKVEKMRLGMILMHLRKVTNHPYLFDGAEEGPPYDRDLTHLVENCGKMVILDRLLTRLKEEGSRVLIFSQMTRVLDILEDYCEWRGHTYHRLDGKTEHEDRAVMIDEFNAEGSSTFLFMLSTRAGGLGINLATADSVIMYDSDWNPQADLQAIDRAHRIGQKKQVRVFRLVTENTIDEKIIEKAEVKLRLDRLVIQKGLTKDQPNPNAIDKTEMLNMIRFDANEILKQKGSNISDEDIDTILKKCESRTQAEFEKLEKLEKEGETSLRKFTLDTSYSVYQFEGEDWKQKQKEHNAELFIELPKRQRKLVNYTGMNDGGTEATSGPAYAPPGGGGRAPKSIVHTRTYASMEPPKPAVQYHEFQFLPFRIFELADKEKFFHYKQVGYRIPITVYNQNNSNIAKFNSRVDVAQPLSAEEVAEKQRLLQQGFPTWTRRQFDMFIQGLAEYGEADMASVTACVDGKTLVEVEAYHKVFCQRLQELKNYEHISQMLSAGEEQRLRKAAIKQNLDAKIKSYRQPFLELKLKYPPLINSKYSEDADRFLVCMLHRLGLYGKHVYAQLRHAVQTQFYPKQRNDLFLKTRTAMNLHERCDYLMSLIQREAQTNGGNFVGTRHTPATIIGPVVDLDSSEDEEESEEIVINSDVVLIDSDSDTPTNGYRKAVAASVRQKVVPKVRPAILTHKKKVTPTAPPAEAADETSSGEETEVEEVVPVGSSDSEQFDLAEYLAQNGYKNHAQQVKRSLPAVKVDAPSKPKKRKLETTVAVTEILELDDSSMESTKSAKDSKKDAKGVETKPEGGENTEDKNGESRKSEKNIEDSSTEPAKKEAIAEENECTSENEKPRGTDNVVEAKPAAKEDTKMETENESESCEKDLAKGEEANDEPAIVEDTETKTKSENATEMSNEGDLKNGEEANEELTAVQDSKVETDKVSEDCKDDKVDPNTEDCREDTGAEQASRESIQDAPNEESKAEEEVKSEKPIEMGEKSENPE